MLRHNYSVNNVSIMTPEQVLRAYYENANEINAITARRQPTFEEKVRLAKMIGTHLKQNIMGRQPEGAWFNRKRMDEGLYAEPKYNWAMGEIPGPIKGIGQSEVIVAAGIKLKDGRVFKAPTHHMAMEEFDKAGLSIRDWKSLVDDADVFVTSRGRTLTRKEAVELTGERSEDASDIIGHDITFKGKTLTGTAYEIADSGKYTLEQIQKKQREFADLSNALRKEGKFQEAMDAASNHQMWREAAERLQGQLQHFK